jgi:hypothetical protein
MIGIGGVGGYGRQAAVERQVRSGSKYHRPHRAVKTSKSIFDTDLAETYNNKKLIKPTIRRL